MRNPQTWIILSLLLGVSAPTTGPALAVDGVLSLTPVNEHSCIAVEFIVGAETPVSGVRFFNNDATAPFARLLLMEGQKGIAPDLGQTGLVLTEIPGENLAWGNVSIDPPVSSSTGVIHAVIELPPFTERTGDGQGGGTGIGYELAGC